MKKIYALPDMIKQIFYYQRNMYGTPLICVCLLVHINTHDVHARGIAICNVKDNCNKKIGRTIASGRASKAFVNASNIGDTTHIDSEIYTFLREDQDICKTTFNYKSEYKPLLSSYEEKLVKNVFKLEEKVNGKGE